MEGLTQDGILDSEYHEEKNSWEGVIYATFWQRAAASILDSLIMIPVGLLTYLITNLGLAQGLNILFSILLTLVFPAYKIYLEAHYGATLGKMAVQLRVVNSEAGLIDFNQSLKRYSLYGISTIATILLILLSPIAFELSFISTAVKGLANLIIFVSVIYVFTDARKQALHDKIAETYVILNNHRRY